MKEEVMDEKISLETSPPGKRKLTEILKNNVKELTADNCKGCAEREDAMRKVAGLGGKAGVGVGAGLCLGVGALATAAVAGVAIPAISTFGVFALIGGFIGLVKGAKDFNK